MPIAVPQNVTIQGAVAGTPATVDVPANVLGFTLAAPASGLDNLIVDGTLLPGNNGIQVGSGSAATTGITNVEVRNLANGGIAATGAAVLTLGTNVSVPPSRGSTRPTRARPGRTTASSAPPRPTRST